MEQFPESPQNEHTKRIVMTAAGVFLLLFVAVSVLAYLRREPSTTARATGRPSKQSSIHPGTDASELPGFPEVTVNRWNLLGAAAIAGNPTAAAAVYPLKENLTKTDFTRLALAVRLQPQATEENGERIMGGRESGNESSILYLQKRSGAFLFKATDGLGIQSSSSAQPGPQQIQEFVNNLIGDPTVRLGAMYKKTTTPDVTYYEFHRDRNLTRLPIMSMMGLFNLPPQFQLSELTSARGYAAQTLERDEDITATSDDADGRARASDFNTLTVAARGDKIIGVVSNLRLPDTQKQVQTTPVIPYTEAVKRLDTNQYAKIVTSPAGTGLIDHAAIYPGDKASFRSVTVTDSELVYLEELPNARQSQLVPYYVFRGYGVLQSGYRANVLAAVAASAKDVLSAATQKQEISLPAQPLVTAPSVPAAQAPLIASKCMVPPGINDLSNVQTDKSGTIFGQLLSKDPGKTYDPDQDHGEWFAIPASGADVQRLNAVLDSIYSKTAPAKQRMFMRVAAEYERAQGNQCADRITI